MIATIGSLVKETANRGRWVLATTLYVVACGSSSMLLGVLLGGFGAGLRDIGSPSLQVLSRVVVGLLAVAYAASDLGLVRLPRPHVLYAVPVTWWRWWQPYGAALAYGAVLGLGLTTYVAFGGIYVVCAWSVVVGSPWYGGLLLGTYGFARALTIVPASWFVFDRRACGVIGRDLERQERIGNIMGIAHAVIALALVVFGTAVLASSFAI